jgi:chromosome segregation ATPase
LFRRTRKEAAQPPNEAAKQPVKAEVEQEAKAEPAQPPKTEGKQPAKEKAKRPARAEATQPAKPAAKAESVPPVTADLATEQAKLAELEAALAELTTASTAAKAEYSRLERRINAAGQMGLQGALAQQQRQVRLLEDRVRGARAKLTAARAAVARLAEPSQR